VTPGGIVASSGTVGSITVSPSFRIVVSDCGPYLPLFIVATTVIGCAPMTTALIAFGLAALILGLYRLNVWYYGSTTPQERREDENERYW
jgi:hypothetical protein